MPTNGEGTVLWRVARLESEVDKLDDGKADESAVAQLRDEVASLRRALYTFSLSVVGSAVLFALAVFQLLAKGG